MNRDELITSVSNTYKKVLETIKVKNQDYSQKSNPFSNFESAGIVGVDPKRAILVRILDKLSRISILLDKEPSVVNESIIDSIDDDIAYLALLKAKIEDENKDKTQNIKTWSQKVPGGPAVQNKV